MRRALAIAKLAFWEGVRMRIVLIALVLLVFLILRMPFALRGDETLAGRLQNFLAYSLGALGFLLSLATIFFSCATLANEFKERSLHLIVTKPVTRFQILLGKWIGVNLLTLMIIAICGTAIYAFAGYIRTRPMQFERDRYKVRDVVWTARYAAVPVAPPNMRQQAIDEVNSRIRTGDVPPEMKNQAVEQRFLELAHRWRVVDSGDSRLYRFENLSKPEYTDTVIQVRFQTMASPIPFDEIVEVGWVFCDPDTGAPLHQPVFTAERNGDIHQFLATGASVIKDGRAALLVLNPLRPQTGYSVIFEGNDSLQILYKAGSFELNYAKALLLIILRLALLSAVGIFFGSFVSFPVACVCTFAFYLLSLGQQFWLEAIGANMPLVLPSIDPFGHLGPAIRAILVPIVVFAFPDFSQLSGTRALVDGEFIPLEMLGWATLRTIVYGGVLLLLLGWFIFRRREVAEVIV